jgi:guanidinobutyrase
MPKTIVQPLGGNVLPRFAGPATMMRLPSRDTAQDLDACFVGVPIDQGTSNRPGTRFGPRQIRAESAHLRPYNMGTRAAPFDALAVADLGDVPVNPYDLKASMPIVEQFYDAILKHDCRPLTMGGDHISSWDVNRNPVRCNASSPRTDAGLPSFSNSALGATVAHRSTAV